MQTALPLNFDSLSAEVVIDWKGGKRFLQQTSVSRARAICKREQGNKRVRWIKVTIPKPDSTLAMVVIYEPKVGYSKNIVDLPSTSN